MQTRPPATIIVFAKAPIPGHAKTRLIPRLGAEGAAQIHQKLVRQTIKTALRCNTKANIQLHYSEAHPFFLRILREFKVDLLPQFTGNLGQRIDQAFTSHKKTPALTPILLMGSDCPSITPAHIEQCIHSLAKNDFVFLPAEDGGYGLIGTKYSHTHKIHHLVSGVPWGTNTVMALTRKKLIDIGATWDEPATIWDVDRAEDLDRLNTLIPTLLLQRKSNTPH